jgi:hypothetical protein
MADPFDTADTTIFGRSPAASATVTNGATTYPRRAVLSSDVEYADLTSGVSMRVDTVQFPRVGGLRPKVSTVTIGAVVYVLEQRLSDDGYAETWRVKA